MNEHRTLGAGNRVTGTPACSGNDPAAAGNGIANRVTGPRQGECAGL